MSYAATESDLYCSGTGAAIRLPLASSLGHSLLHPRSSPVDDRGVR
jgi:hypothetical protein